MAIDNNHSNPAPLPLLSLAFRPFFLGGTLFAVVAVSWWVYFWLNPFSWQPHGGALWWHAHEMLFGFGTAIVAGFLLTAVASWTGVAALQGGQLLILAAIWLSGRLLIAFGSGLPVGAVVAGDLFFLLLVSGAMAYPILKARQWRNLAFLPMLLVLTLLNGMSHWAVATGQTALAMQSLDATILWFVLLMAFLAGRVIPAFTANASDYRKAPPLPWLDAASIITIILMLIVAWAGFSSVPSWLLFGIASTGALANGWRFGRWGFQYSWNEPLLWSLHLAYAFIPLGFVALALHSLGLMDNLSAALHGFTVGAMGGMILAMISRVTLGHTGRPLEPPRLIPLAYIAILLAALVRIALPAWLPALTNWGIAIAGGLWVLAYAIYLLYYAPMLISANVERETG
ncbi:MAG: NnrS family protein [Gammaproteobacteria bacterium]|nr:NnrS family protein [Gammaproteobacteria bacterium]MCW8841349.1 NnrS family protein [Gammaproteobacteria bacterium]MCW8928057.1 NnrS family protein [Gammaproteobacteria bacterium]MCW8958944.1 NnrS family protein [Gammaproteobacteria bacterium]MCW8973446.1 NnrS family protein [Gammaproteobacteria bacterium]